MASDLSWNVTYDGMSPMFQFWPYSDTSTLDATNESTYLSSGWVTWFTDSLYIKSGQEDAIGDPYHLTSLYGASMTLDYYGSGVILYGESNSSYLITMDGSNITDATVQDGVLYSSSSQTIGNHTVILTALPDAEQKVLEFQQAIVTSNVDTSFEQPTVVQVSSQESESYSFIGSWEASRIWPGVPNPTETSPFRFTSDEGSSFSIQFNGRAAAIYGSATSSHQLYDVTLDGATQTLNGSTPWLIGNTMLFFEDNLDQNAMHTLSVVNGDGAFAFNYVQIWQFQNYTTSYSSPSGSSLASLTATPTDSTSGGDSTPLNVTAVIAGSVVAASIAFLAATVALWRWNGKRKRQEEADTFSPSPFLVKSSSTAGVSGLEEDVAMSGLSSFVHQDFGYSNLKQKQKLELSSLAQLKPAYQPREPSLVQAILSGRSRGRKNEGSVAEGARTNTRRVHDGPPKYDDIDRH